MAQRTRDELKANINRDIVQGDANSITVAEVNAILIDNADSMALEGHTHSATAQVRSDWSQANTASPAYILNKPTIPDPLPDTAGSEGRVLKVGSDGVPAWLPDLAGRNLEFTSETTTAVSGNGSASGTAGTRAVPITAGAVNLASLTSDGSVYTLVEEGVWSFNFSTSVSAASPGNATFRFFHHLEYSTDAGSTWAPTAISPDLYTRANPNLASARINGNHVWIGKESATIQFRWMSSSADQDIRRAAYAAGELFLIRLG